MQRMKFSDDEGSSSLEFITAGLVLLVPLIYLILVVASIQAATLASEGAARQAARVYVTASSQNLATERAGQAIDVALADFHISPDRANVAIVCSDSSSCLSSGSFVTITVKVEVPLPLIPPVLGLDHIAQVPIASQATAHVSKFHGEMG